MGKKKVAFICVHNSCRSQIAEALGKHLRGDEFDFYSAGTETKPQINQDAVRLMKQLYGIDMEQHNTAKPLIKFLLRILLSQWAVMSGVRISAELLMITGDFKTQQDKVMKSLLKLLKKSKREFLNFNVLDGYSNEQPSFLICRNTVSVDNGASNRVCFGSASVSGVALNGIDCAVLTLLYDTGVVCHTVALPIKKDDCTG